MLYGNFVAFLIPWPRSLQSDKILFFSLVFQMEENVNSCPSGDGAFSSTFLHAIMLEIYFFSKLKLLKPSNQNFPFSYTLYSNDHQCLLSEIVFQRWSYDEYAWSLSYLLLSVPYSIMLFTIISCWKWFCKHSNVTVCI